jgi:hypothetical protein
MRTLDSSQQTAVAASHVTAALLVQMEFASGTIYLTTAGRDVSWNGQTWLSARGGNVEPMREAVTSEATGLRFSLAGPIAAYLSAALQEHVQGKPVKVYVALFDANEALIGTPVEEWSGLVDTMTVEEASDGNSAIVVTAESRYAQFARPKVRRHNDADQQAVWSGDQFYKFAPDLVERPLIWPNREWFKRNP